MLASQHIPPTAVPEIPKILSNVLEILTKQMNIETKSLRKEGKKELKVNY